MKSRSLRPGSPLAMAEPGANDHVEVIAKEPSRWDWKAGDLVYIPENTIHQHFNADPNAPARFVAGTNRLYKMIGYSRIEQLENAPEFGK